MGVNTDLNVDVKRPRIAPTWLVLTFAGVVLCALYFMHPRGGLRERMTSTDAPSEVSVAYLEAWLRVQPDNEEILSVLGTQYVSLGRDEDARRIVARMETRPSDELRRQAVLLRLQLDLREAFSFPDDDPRREATLERVRAQVAQAATLTWPTDSLQTLAEIAASVNAQALAGQLYARLAAQDTAHQARWNREVVRFAMYGGDYRGAADGWFRLQASAETFEAQRDCFLNGIRALQAGNLLDEALAAAQAHGAAFAHDRQTLVLLLNLARAAHRPDLVDRYAKALAGYARVQPEDGAVRLVAYLRARSAQQPFTYMDGATPRRQSAEKQGDASAARGVQIVRIAASQPATADRPAPASQSAAPAADDLPGLLYQSFLESNDLANAQRVASEQVAKNPGSAEWARRLAQVAEWNHASPLALKMWLQYAQRSNDPEGWKNVMRLAPMLNDDEAYLAALIQASNAAPGDLGLIDKVVAAYERLGRPDNALTFLRSRAGRAQQDAIDWRIGQLAERAGHDDEALARYRKLGQRNPANTQYALRSASMLYRHADLQGALDTLLAARPHAQDDDPLFWRNTAQLARLLQRDDIANDAYRHLLASGQAQAEDLGAMTYFYVAYPIDAARTAELEYQKDQSSTALASAVHYYAYAGRYDSVEALLERLSPAQTVEAESDPGFLRERAEYYRLTDHPAAALADLERGAALPGAPLDLRVALMWTLVDYGTDAQLRDVIAPYRDAAAVEPALWGPIAAVQVRLDRPEAALSYLRRQAASMSKDPLWQLAFADAQEMAGHGDLAWSIRRGVWRQMQQEEAAIRAHSGQGNAVLRARATQGIEGREQLQGRRVTLSAIFGSADVAKAFLSELLANDAGRKDNTEALRTLLGDTKGLPPVQMKSQAKTQAAPSQDPTRLTSSVARDVALAWAVSREANPMAKRWLAREYADTLSQPSEQRIAIALAEDDKAEMARLLDETGHRLPIANRIDALRAVDRPGAAEQAAFEGLDGAPENAELHTRLVETAMEWPQSLDAGVTSYVEHPLDYVEQTLSGSRKIADHYMIGINGTLRFQHSTDDTQLANVPSVDRSVDLYVRRQTYDSAFQVSAGRREALDGFYSVSAEAEWGRNSALQLSVRAGRNQTARESQALLIGGMKDNVIGTVRYSVTPHLYASGSVEADRFYSQARNYLGSGVLTSGELGYRIRTGYPDYTIRLIGARGHYSASGDADALISRLLPATTGPVTATSFMPQTYTQYGLFFGFGSELVEQYTRAWRPFLDVGVVHDSNQGWGPGVNLGLAGTVFGGDHAALYFSHQRVSRIGTPVTEFGARYSWFY